MPPAKLAASLALLGGVLWILHALLGGGDGTLLDVLHVAGYVCLMGASAVFGTTLVKGDAVGVRAGGGGAGAQQARTGGVVAVLLGGLALARGRGRSPARRPAGAHAR